MVQPINYSTDVLSPVQGYLQGLKFGEGLNTDRLNQQATTQNMGIQREQMDLQLRQYEDAQRARAQAAAAAQANAAAQRAAATAGRDALLNYYNKAEAGEATPADLRRAMIQFPGMMDQFQSIASSFSEDRKNNEISFGQQLNFALSNGNVDAAENLLRTRQQAAEAAGDARSAAAYKAQLLELEEDPQGLMMQTDMALLSMMPQDDFENFYTNITGRGGDAASPQSGVGKLQADLRAGLISQEEYDVAVQNMAPTGMVIESTPGGGFTMRQGVGVNADDGRLSPSDPAAMLNSIEGILNDPALDTSTGILSPLQNIPGTPQRGFAARANQLEGQAFLQAFESLKGAGQITEIEGLKATQAIGRLDTAQSPTDYRNALNDLKEVLEAAQGRGQGGATEGPPANVPPEVWDVMTPEEKALFQ